MSEQILTGLIIGWAIYIIALIVSLVIFPGSISNLLYAFITGIILAIVSIPMVLISKEDEE